MESPTVALERLPPSAGRLLVASPALLDPQFAGTIVLILELADDGAVGVVLNRPSSVAVDSVLDGWQRVVDEPDVLFVGGPVGTDSALAVARLANGAAADPAGADALLGWRQVVGNLGLLDLDSEVEALVGEVGNLRIFAGYAGWSAGQLEREIGEGSWYVVPGDVGDPFVDPGQIWARVLGRQQGALAWLSTLPQDPQQN